MHADACAACAAARTALAVRGSSTVLPALQLPRQHLFATYPRVGRRSTHRPQQHVAITFNYSPTGRTPIPKFGQVSIRVLPTGHSGAPPLLKSHDDSVCLPIVNTPIVSQTRCGLACCPPAPAVPSSQAPSPHETTQRTRCVRLWRVTFRLFGPSWSALVLVIRVLDAYT